MNLSAIHICEHATIDRDSRLSMLNAFTHLRGEAPGQVPRVCIVMVFTFGSDQRGRSHTARVEFLTGNREAFLKPIEFPFTLSIRTPPLGCRTGSSRHST
jgi:hypothetical protein